MNANTATKCLDYMQASGEALAASQELIEKLASDKEAATEKSAAVANRVLTEFQLIEAHELPMLQAKLASHSGAVEVLNNLLTAHRDIVTGWKQKLAVANANGQPVAEKTASASATKHRVMGQASGLGERLPSDQHLLDLVYGS